MPTVTLPTIKAGLASLVKPRHVKTAEIAHYTIRHVDGRKDHGLVPAVIARQWQSVGLAENPRTLQIGDVRPIDHRGLGFASVTVRFGPEETVTFMVLPELADRWATDGAGERFARLLKDYKALMGGGVA